VAGTAGGDFALIRYRPDGSLDPGFGQGGKVTTDIEGNDVAEGLALQPDGRILVAGYSRQIPGSFVATLVRYRPDGSLDPSFGQGGKFITNFNDYLNYWTLAHAVAIQPDGKILVAGDTTPLNQGNQYPKFYLGRLNPDGTPDPGFGSDGRVIFDVGENSGQSFNALVLQPDGKILAAGAAPYNGFSHTFALARFTTDGWFDPGFNGGSLVSDLLSDIPRSPDAIALDGNGRIVAVTDYLGILGSSFFSVRRYQADGHPDPTFGQSGRVEVTFSDGTDSPQAVAIQPNGKVLAAGSSRSAVPPVLPGEGWERFAIVRLLGDEPVMVDPPGVPILEPASDTGLDSTDRITAAAAPVLDVPSAGAFNSVQLLRDGQPVGTRAGPGPITDPGPIQDGVHRYQAVQMDQDGNLSPSSASSAVLFDSMPPELPSTPVLAVDFDTGVKGDGLTAVRQPHWVGTAEPGSLVQLLDSFGSEVGSSTASADGSYSIAPRSPLSDGIFPFHARDMDPAGNVSDDGATFYVTIDATPPPQPSPATLASSDVAGTLGASSYTRTRQPHLTGLAEPHARVQFLDASGNVIAETDAGSDGRYSARLNGPLPDGPFAVRVQAIDAAGNVSGASTLATFSVNPATAISPVLVVVTHGQQFDPFGGGRRNERGDWVDQLADGIQRELVAGLQGSGALIKVIEPNWDTFGGSNRPAEFIADYIKRITDDPSVSPDPWDILLLGHSRGAIFNNDVAKLLGGDVRIDYVEEILLDPTASHPSGDQYPTSVPDPVAHLIDYDDRRSLQEVFGQAAENIGRAVGGQVGKQVGMSLCRSLGPFCAFIGENVGKMFGADLGRDLGRHAVTDGEPVPGAKGEYRDVRAELDRYLAIHPHDPRTPSDLAAQSHSAVHDWYLVSPYLHQDIADFLARKDHGATASGASHGSPIILSRETVLPPSDAPTLAKFIEVLTAKVKQALRDLGYDVKVLVQKITREAEREIRQVVNEAKRTVRNILNETRRAGSVVKREAAREIRQVQHEASRTVQNIKREVKSVASKVSRTFKKIRKHF
jgi:uncharacterized delta-60 repeat protein